MINLLPDDYKRELRAARMNVQLTRYMGVILMAGAFLLLILAGSYYLLNQTKLSSQQLIDANNVKADVFSTTKEKVDQLSAGLAGTKVILDQEIRYSNVLLHFAQQMPAGTVFDKLSLNSSAFEGAPLTLTVYAQTTEEAVALRDAFQQSAFFSEVNFQAISDSGAGIEGYPVSATMTLTLNRSIAQ